MPPARHWQVSRGPRGRSESRSSRAKSGGNGQREMAAIIAFKNDPSTSSFAVRRRPISRAIQPPRSRQLDRETCEWLPTR